ncbi:MAG: hypothetical protein Q4D62_03905 [Planctomycetia bacterium]|nr:hypothetical protein [Planctomycetia bacterium]
MYFRQLFRVLITGLLVLAGTLGIALMFAEEETRSTFRFWIILGPILLSELCLMVSYLRILGKTHTNHFPMLIAGTIVPWIYFIGMLAMIPLYFTGLSDLVLLVFQLLLLLALLVAVSSMEMAGDSIRKHAAEFAVADAPRQNFHLTVTGIDETLRLRFSDESTLRNLLEKLSDSARYAADTVPGGESYDREIETGLARLETLATTAEVPEITTHIQQLLASFRKRETAMKTLR